MPAAPAVDILSQLEGVSLAGVGVPCAMFATKGGHVLAVHHRLDRTGAPRVENVTREGYVWDCHIPITNLLQPGPTETWKQPLFPDVYQKLIPVLESRATVPLISPTYGTRTVKIGPYTERLDPHIRGGPVITVQVVETDDTGETTSTPAPLSVAKAAAFSLDGFLGKLTPPPNTGTPNGQSLSDFIDSIGAISDQAQLFGQQMVGKINGVISQMTGLAEKFGYDPGFSDDTQRLISSLHAAAAAQIAAQRPTSLYIVPADTTIAQIAVRLAAKVDDLIALNPSLTRSLVVPATTAVAYYS